MYDWICKHGVCAYPILKEGTRTRSKIDFEEIIPTTETNILNLAITAYIQDFDGEPTKEKIKKALLEIIEEVKRKQI